MSTVCFRIPAFLSRESSLDDIRAALKTKVNRLQKIQCTNQQIKEAFQGGEDDAELKAALTENLQHEERFRNEIAELQDAIRAHEFATSKKLPVIPVPANEWSSLDDEMADRTWRAPTSAVSVDTTSESAPTEGLHL